MTDINELEAILAEGEHRKKFRAVDFYDPLPKQIEFHNCSTKERLFDAGSQDESEAPRWNATRSKPRVISPPDC